MIKRWNEKKKITYNTWTSYWKSDHWEKWWSQLPLKILGVCSSLRDQQFCFLNHLISSSYENVMIETRYQKLRENFWFRILLLRMNEREWRTVKRIQEREEVINKQLPPHHPRVDRVWHMWAERCCWRVPHVAHTWTPSLAVGLDCSSRAPLAFLDRIRASKLWFRICL